MKQILQCPANKTCRACFRGASILENKIAGTARPMKSLFMIEKNSKISGWAFVLACICITFSLLSPPAQAFIGVLERRPVTSAQRVHRAVWKLENVGEGYYGTAFAIGRKYFLAAFHTWNDLLREGRTLGDIHLVQEGNGRTLTVSRLLAVSATYDLVLFEVNGSVEYYLGLARGFAPGRGERLYALGYRGGSLFKAVPKRKGGGYYHDAWLFGFAANHADLRGMSGGPLLNARGKVIGLQATADANMLYGVRSRHLHGLLPYREGILCPRPREPGFCLRAGKRNTRRLAREGNAVARYQLGRGDSYVNETARERTASLGWLEASARNGFPPAMRRLANLKVDGERDVEKDLGSAASLYERAAARGEPAATYTLIQMYYYGMGRIKDVEKALEMTQKGVARDYVPIVKFLKKMRRENPWLRR